MNFVLGLIAGISVTCAAVVLHVLAIVKASKMTQAQQDRWFCEQREIQIAYRDNMADIAEAIRTATWATRAAAILKKDKEE